MARLCHRVETEFVGTPCGLMDQFAAAASRSGCATLLDCRSLDAQFVRLPDHVVVAIMDTGVRRELKTSAYADRRAACGAAAGALGVRALRDADRALLDRSRAALDPVVYARALHVIEENARPQALAAALQAGDFATAGRLMNDSHAGLRDLYEVSSPELDLVTEQARAHPACFGARMTGGGFGGCAIALVRQTAAHDFARHMASSARAVFLARPEAGARLL